MRTFTIVTTIELSEEEIALLQKLKQIGCAEYRDSQFNSYEDYVNAFDNDAKSLEWFNYRNFGGTITLMNRLEEVGLVELMGECWHITYKISELGETILQDIEKNNEIKILQS